MDDKSSSKPTESPARRKRQTKAATMQLIGCGKRMQRIMHILL